MTIVGFNFTRITAQKKGDQSKKINIKNNIALKGVVSHDLILTESGSKGFNASFEFNSEYSPGMGNISIGGDIFVVKPEKEVKLILDEWKKNKKLPDDLVPQYFGFAMKKFNLKAMNLAEDVNLPSPIPMSKINAVAPSAAQPKK